MSAPLEVEVTSQLINTGIAQKIVQEKITRLQQRNQLVDQYLSDYSVHGTLHSQFRLVAFASEVDRKIVRNEGKRKWGASILL